MNPQNSIGDYYGPYMVFGLYWGFKLGVFRFVARAKAGMILAEPLRATICQNSLLQLPRSAKSQSSNGPVKSETSGPWMLQVFRRRLQGVQGWVSKSTSKTLLQLVTEGSLSPN